MNYLMYKQRKKDVYNCKKSRILGNVQFKFRTVVSEVLSFGGIPVLFLRRL